MKLKYFAIFFICLTVFSNCTTSSPLIEKFFKVSSQFKDAPYTLGPLGEGNGLDSDPLYRFDTFDCLTYVETVLALTFSNNNDEFEKVIKEIRYKNGDVSFTNRHHFQNPDWISYNQKYLSNASEQLSLKVLHTPAKISTINLDRAGWFKHNFNIDTSFLPETVNISYISFSDMKDNLDKLTQILTIPYIFMTVISDNTLKDKTGSEVDISHTGFIVKIDSELYIRHASQKYKKVVDEKLSDYITKMLSSKSKRYKGFAILEIKF